MKQRQTPQDRKSIHWKEEHLFHSGDEFFASLEKAIQGAKSSIDLETYIFDRDKLGGEVLVHLGMAAQRGVRVRLLLDGIGSLNWKHNQLAELSKLGVEAKFYRPLPWYGIWTFFIWMRRLRQLNRRNHRKTCIIDHHTAYVGGMNVSSRHLKRMVGGDAWRDSSVKVSGAPVELLERSFEATWSKSPVSWIKKSQLEADLYLHPLLRLNLTWRLRRSNYRALLRRIEEAQNKIWITTPYFSPEVGLLRALRSAAQAGRDVKILLPMKNDVWIMNWVNRAYYYQLLKGGVRIYEYRPSFLHAKAILIDCWGSVGSSNLNHRSLLHDLEVDVILTHSASIESLEQSFERDLKRSHEIRIHEWIKRSWLKKWFERICLMLKYWT